MASARASSSTRKGHIVTNAHVVSGATSVTVTTSTGKRLNGTLVGEFPEDDLAVIKVDGSGLHPATFADSSKLVVGQIAIAIGNPLGLSSSVTEGIVSALNRQEPEGNGVTLQNAIQTSAAINPGNSGGALVDILGRVIGIPTLAAQDPQFGGAAAGIGFAIPSNTVLDIAGQIAKNGRRDELQPRVPRRPDRRHRQRRLRRRGDLGRPRRPRPGSPPAT